MDSNTLRAYAEVAMKRAMMVRRDMRAQDDRRDLLERLGAAHALEQLAIDFEATARIADWDAANDDE